MIQRDILWLKNGRDTELNVKVLLTPQFFFRSNKSPYCVNHFFAKMILKHEFLWPVEFDEDWFTSVKREVWGEPCCDVKTRPRRLLSPLFSLLIVVLRAIKSVDLQIILPKEAKLQLHRECCICCVKNNYFSSLDMMTRLPMKNARLIRKRLRRLNKNWKENQRTDYRSQ